MKREPEYVTLEIELGQRLVHEEERLLPGLADHIEVMEVGTPLTNVSFVNTPEGSTYGPAHSPDQVGRRRYSTMGPVDGLYLRGCSVYGVGAATCALSGLSAAQAALAHKRPLRQWLRAWRRARLQASTGV